MTHSPQYFPKRCTDDQLDILPVLRDGLAMRSDRCVVACEGLEISAGEMCRRIAHVQAQLRRAGLKPQERVAVMLGNSVEHIALIYALIMMGAIWIPVNVRLRGDGLAYVIEHSRPALMVLGREFEPVTGELPRVRKLTFEAWCDDRSREAGDIECHDLSHRDTLCIIYTSGTTGPPKGVVFTHRMLRIASEAALMVADVRAGDRVFLWEPLCHIGGAQMLMVPFLADAQLHVVQRFSATQFWTQWRAARATHLHYLGGVLDVLMQLPESGAIRTAWGAGISGSAWDAIRRRFGCELRECYGMTECSSFATLNTTGTPGSIGEALPWMHVELLDGSGLPTPRGDIGEIVLSSDLEGVFLPGYLDNPEATANAMKGGKLHTGDMARQLPNDEFAFVGRRSDSMRVRGENVSAWEVERVFAGHAAIKAVAAVGVPSSIGEQDICLYVEFEPSRCVDWTELVAWAKPRLATFQLPRYFRSIEKFELTPSERIRKHVLPKTAAGAWDRTTVEAVF